MWVVKHQVEQVAEGVGRCLIPTNTQGQTGRGSVPAHGVEDGSAHNL